MATCETNGHLFSLGKCMFCETPAPVREPVDPIDQLHMMLRWDKGPNGWDEYTDEFKRKCLIDAIEFVSRLKEERK